MLWLSIITRCTLYRCTFYTHQVPHRTVATMDVHDDLVLQDGQLKALLQRLRREKKELCLTFWLAEESAAECLVDAPLPVPRLKTFIPDKWYHTSGADGEPGLHAHMDAGMNICTGHPLRFYNPVLNPTPSPNP